MVCLELKIGQKFDPVKFNAYLEEYQDMKIDPSVVKDAVNISTWAYNPITYIPENITLMNYPTINGYKNFKEALSNSSNIMLGSSINQRLLFRKAPIIERQAHENIQPNEPTGSESMNQRIDAKVKVFC